MKKTLVFLTLLSLCAWLYAQTEAPAETEILLPPAVGEITDVALEAVEAPLPELEEVELASSLVPLPATEDIELAASAFEAPDADGEAGEATAEASSIFSNGLLGAGSMNHILGRVSLYKLGENPQFQLEFSHEGRDGYSFEPAGTGYFDRLDRIEGAISASAEKISGEAEAGYTEREIGLQGGSRYFSVTNRFLAANGRGSWQIDPLLALSLAAEGSYTTRLGSVAERGLTTLEESELSLGPSLGALLEVDGVSAGLDLGYKLKTAYGTPLESAQALEAGLDLGLEIGPSLRIGANAGLYWPIGDALLYPFSAEISGTVEENLTLRAGGGFRVEPLGLRGLWQESAAVRLRGLPDAALLQSEWFSETGFAWTLLAGSVTAEGSLAFRARRDAVRIDPFNETVGLFPVSLVDLVTLEPELSVSFRRGTDLRAELGWNARFIERLPREPAQSFEAVLEGNFPDERFGGSLSARFDLFGLAELPMLGVSSYFRASEGVEFVLEVEDILAPALEQGRASIGPRPSAEYPFIEPGFGATVYARISL